MSLLGGEWAREGARSAISVEPLSLGNFLIEVSGAPDVGRICKATDGIGNAGALWGIRKDPHGKDPQTCTPQQKVAILREHLVEHVPVSDLCDKHKLHPTLFYQWQKAFFENGAAAFEGRRPRSQSLSKEEDKIAALEAKLRDKTEVLSEVVEELVRTKKELGES